ncbi:MAG: carbohydrate ABC transporter permease, partial [Bacillota bacterium]
VNFKTVFGDEVFYKTIYNTFIFAAGTIPLTMAVSLLLAVLTNRRIAGVGFYKCAYFLPMVTSSVSIAMVWYWLYAPDFGLINTFLNILGIQGPPWLADPAWARIAIIIMSAWLQMGYFYIIFLAGLKNIPNEYYEAAYIDGGNSIRVFFKITLPMLSPVTFFVLITLFIGTFNMFNESYILTRGGPSYATYTLVMYIFFRAFQLFRMGEASVASMVLFITVGLITLLQFRLSRKLVNYDI